MGTKAQPKGAAHSFSNPSHSPSLPQWVDFSLGITSKGWFPENIKKISARQKRESLKSREQKVSSVATSIGKPEVQNSNEPTLFVAEMNSPTKHAYQRLSALSGILPKEGSSWLKIKREYRRLAKKLHPDRNHSENGSDRAAHQFTVLSEAYSLLTTHYQDKKK